MHTYSYKSEDDSHDHEHREEARVQDARLEADIEHDELNQTRYEGQLQ